MAAKTSSAVGGVKSLHRLLQSAFLYRRSQHGLAHDQNHRQKQSESVPHFVFFAEQSEALHFLHFKIGSTETIQIIFNNCCLSISNKHHILTPTKSKRLANKSHHLLPITVNLTRRLRQSFLYQSNPSINMIENQKCLSCWEIILPS